MDLKIRLLQKINPSRDIRHIKLSKKEFPQTNARPRLKSSDEHVPPGTKSTLELNPPWKKSILELNPSWNEVHLVIKFIVELNPSWNVFHSGMKSILREFHCRFTVERIKNE